MFAFNIFACAVLLAGANARSLVVEDPQVLLRNIYEDEPQHYLGHLNEEQESYLVPIFEEPDNQESTSIRLARMGQEAQDSVDINSDGFSGLYVVPIIEEPFENREHTSIPVHLSRMRRQAQGSVEFNSDGTSAANLKVPFAGNDKNKLSAIGAIDMNKNFKVASGTAGLALDNVNGHGLTLTKTLMPGVGDRVAAAGKLNLFHNNDHNLDAKAFAARTTLNNPALSFNTVGGGVDYMFKDKVGAGLNVAHTPLFQKTDYSATGNLNLFRGHDSSLDFKAGLSKSVSPYMPRSSWEPFTGFTFRKFF